jgi:hypothetical protein
MESPLVIGAATNVSRAREAGTNMKETTSLEGMYERERQEKAEFEAGEAALEGDDLEAALQVYRQRYAGTSAFYQAQRGYDKHVDDDRIRKIRDRR